MNRNILFSTLCTRLYDGIVMIKIDERKTKSRDFYPEDSIEKGHIAIDIKKEEVIEYLMPKGYEKSKSYLAHAVDGLSEMIETNENEKTIMWY